MKSIYTILLVGIIVVLTGSGFTSDKGNVVFDHQTTMSVSQQINNLEVAQRVGYINGLNILGGEWVKDFETGVLYFRTLEEKMHPQGLYCKEEMTFEIPTCPWPLTYYYNRCTGHYECCNLQGACAEVPCPYC